LINTPLGESLVCEDTSLLIMCQAVLNDPRVFALLLRIDEEEAARIRALRWRCDGPLHVAVQARKPRGGLWPRAADRTRLSFCHGQCRRRRTPRSVRFLGRRVYYGVVVVLASALAGELRAGREARLLVALGVPRRTLRRWRQWWLTEFISTPFWTARRGAFLPPLVAAALPGSLLQRFGPMEFEYQRSAHRELPGTPPDRFVAGPSVLCECPSSEFLQCAFRIEVTRKQRFSDGTVSLDGRAASRCRRPPATCASCACAMPAGT